MAKFTESNLAEILKDFENIPKIELEFDKSLEGKIVLSNALIKYDSKYGFINITSEEGEFKINTTLIYSYEKIDKEIIIDLDTISLKIKRS